MLEDIIKDFEFAKEIEGEEYGYYGLSDQQIEWLILEAKKVKLYKEALDYLSWRRQFYFCEKSIRGKSI